MKFRSHLRCCAAVILSVVLAGCGNMASPVSTVAGKVSDAYQVLSHAAVQNQSPITISLWHGFEEEDACALEQIVDAFNTSVGEENHIQVQLTGYAGTDGVEQAVFEAVREENEKTDDLKRLPDLFFGSDDMAYRLDQINLAVHLDDFLTEDEIDSFLETVKAEAFPGERGVMTLFPIGIDTTVLLVNASRWMEFCNANSVGSNDNQNLSIDSFSTWEGIFKAASAYQEWDLQKKIDAIDAGEDLEVDPVKDAASFFAADSWGTLMASGYRGMGGTIFTVDDESICFDFDRDRIRTFWDFWYLGSIRGYFAETSAQEAFAAGEAVACLVSTTEGRNYRNKVRYGQNARTELVDIDILSTPYFVDGTPVTMQETLGLVAVSGSQEHLEAVKVFLRYLMEPQRMAELAVCTGRLPALKKSVSDSVLEAAFEAQDLTGLERMILTQAKQQLYSHIQVPLAVFEGSENVLSVMDESLSQTGTSIRNRYETVVSSGLDAEQAFSLMTGNKQFDRWYTSFRDRLVEAVFMSKDIGA